MTELAVYLTLVLLGLFVSGWCLVEQHRADRADRADQAAEYRRRYRRYWEDR